MAVINGFLSQAIVYASIANANVTADFFNAEDAGSLWPPLEVLEGDAPIESLTTHWPVSAPGFELTGFVAGAYSDDFYHRIHITPSLVELGNVVSIQTSEVVVWNAYLEPVTLNEITGIEEGIELSGQSEPPLDFLGLEERTWSVAITPDGPAVLNAFLTWIFSNGDEVQLHATGNRISAFTWKPDWADAITERLAWATDILQSRTGTEQRRSLRLTPRREIDVDIYVADRDRQAFDLAMFGWSSQPWAIPIWPDVQQLPSPLLAGAETIPCSTAHRDFRIGGLVMLLGETSFHYEAAEILSFDSNSITLKRPLQNAWPAGSALYPVRTARLKAAPRLIRMTDTLQQGRSVSFMVMDSSEWDAEMPATTYRGWPVFDVVPNENDDLTSEYQHLMLSLDNGSAIPVFTDTADLAFPIVVHRWLLYGAAERAEFRSFMYALAGRQKSLWIPTHADDLHLVAQVLDAATTLDIVNIGYTRFAQVKTFRRDIRIELHSGTVFYRRITGSTEINADVERLLIDSALGQLVNPGDVMRISWLMLMRADSDEVEIKHENDIEGIATASQVFRGVRDEL